LEPHATAFVYTMIELVTVLLLGHFLMLEELLHLLTLHVAGKFLNALTQDGSVNEAALCSQQLDRLFGPLREQVAQSLKRQDVVLRQLKVGTLALISCFVVYLS